MNRYITALCFLAAAASAPADGPTEREKAMAATAGFGTALKAELVGAMQSGGPLAAIEVCNTRAPDIAAAVSLEQGVEVSRLSLKNRNPDNAANEWQANVLKTFEERVEEGEDAGSLTWQETVEVDGQEEYRFMKAIPTGGVCLACHGKNIDPAVTEKLAELYPEDKATGFSEGELRGAFVVSRKL
ncbi:MAG: DUF3365 domain-containing protein [Xanthomonadales bacterium]|jgi:hypothetical protein|nr:DUF3365 domain-containing protein [Xanthomonadales bacterium]